MLQSLLFGSRGSRGCLVFCACAVHPACSGAAEPEAAGVSGPAVTPSADDPCNLASGFEGDELCILPPAADEGIQIHVGPASYTDEEALAPYVIDGGDEDVRCYLVEIPKSGFYYLKQENRMRSGSHHMLVNLVADEGQPEGPVNCDSTQRIASIPGSQTAARDFPDQLGPEDEGLARYLPEGAMASFQLHYVNTGKTRLLREAWVNLYELDESNVSQQLQSVFLVADLAVNVAPHTQQFVTNRFTPNLTEPTRIFELNAHMHAHTESFAVWRVRGAEQDLVYKSFDWSDPDELTYNSVVTNPAPDEHDRKDGGHTGALVLEPGDALEWTCDVNNTLDTSLKFANAAYTAEMCLLAGAYVSDTSGLFQSFCAGGTCADKSK